MICVMGKVHTALSVRDIAIYMTASGSKISARVLVKKSQRKGNTTETGSMIRDMVKALV